MRFLFADVKVDHRYDEDDYEQQQCSGTCFAFCVTAFKRFIYKADHRLQVRVTADTHVVAEYTDDARIFLEAADEARDDYVCKHRGKHRNGNSPEHSPFGSAVDFSCFIKLFINALQAAQKDKNLEGKGIPNDINDHYDVVHCLL